MASEFGLESCSTSVVLVTDAEESVSDLVSGASLNLHLKSGKHSRKVMRLVGPQNAP